MNDRTTQPDPDRAELDFRTALTPEQYRVMREHGTERPGSSPLNTEKRQGIFRCAACGLECCDVQLSRVLGQSRSVSIRTES